MISIVPVIRSERPDRLGRCPVMIRITQARRSTYQGTGLRILEEHWDPAKRMALRSAPNAHMINSTLSRKVLELEKSILEKSMHGSITLEQIKRDLKDPGDSDLYKYADNMITDGRLKASTVKQYRGELGKLQRYWPGALHFNAISLAWLKSYESWMVKEMGNQINTVWKSMKFLKTVFNTAIKDGQAGSTPFLNYKIRYKQPLRSFLLPEELLKMELLATGIPEQIPRLTMLYFLLGCHTGLRLSDLKKLPQGKMIQGERIIISTQKTGEIVSIRMSAKVKALLEQINSQEMPVEQVANRYIKRFALMCGIRKNISFHTSRHTFAVISAHLGIPKEVAQKLLGHTSMKTTEIYYKISSTVLDDAMKKWDNYGQ